MPRRDYSHSKDEDLKELLETVERLAEIARRINQAEDRDETDDGEEGGDDSRAGSDDENAVRSFDGSDGSGGNSDTEQPRVHEYNLPGTGTFDSVIGGYVLPFVNSIKSMVDIKKWNMDDRLSGNLVQVIANKQPEFNKLYHMAEQMRKSRAEIAGLMRSAFGQGDDGETWVDLFNNVLWRSWIKFKT